MKQKKYTRCEDFYKNLYGYSLMMWDGLGFFGTDHKKLGRLKGERVNFCTNFKSPRSVAMSVIGLALGSFLILTEVTKLNLPKS